MEHAVYTEKNNCQDCYKCVRECPVKAIRIENHTASVIAELCVACGHCVQVCPVGAKRIRNDIETVQSWIDFGRTVVVSLAPSFVSQLRGWQAEHWIGGLHALGFKIVSETALGADMVSAQTHTWLGSQMQPVAVSQCCPAISLYIKKYRSEWADTIVPLDTPMLAHAKLLRETYGKSIKVVFVGPCAAKKVEAELSGGLVDAALTFGEMAEWFDLEGVTLETIGPQPFRFEPFEAGGGVYYPVEGGMVAAMRRDHQTEIEAMAVSGFATVKKMLSENAPDTTEALFLELLACPGGCINGPGMIPGSGLLTRFKSVKQRFKTLQPNHHLGLMPDLVNHYHQYTAIALVQPDPSAIQDALNSIGKNDPSLELNCGGCGYEHCRDLASAIVQGQAEREMCVSYMRSVAHNKASALLQRMPFAVVLADENIKVIEANRRFAQLCGADTELAFQARPGLSGANLKKMLPEAYNTFQTLFLGSAETVETDCTLHKTDYHCTTFVVQQKHIACAIFSQKEDPLVKKDEVIRRADRVIEENLKTVRQIASILGENAANTEALLGSLKKLYDGNTGR